MSSVIKTLLSRPWLGAQSAATVPVDVRLFSSTTEMVGLRVFLAVATSLFLLFIAGYRMRSGYPDWRPLAEPALLWFNTALLFGASIALEVARQSVARDVLQSRIAFYAGGLLTVAFIAGQLLVWQQFLDAGYHVASNPAASSFYLLTGVHGLHLLGGLVAWARALSRYQRPSETEALGLSLSLCAQYWHFLFIIWLVLFYLLLST